MELPNPPPGKFANVEVMWAGDDSTGHLSVSLRIGTIFGVTNAYSERIARDVLDCDELCQCDIHADTGDLMASFHVRPQDWQDYAHAVHRKIIQYVGRDVMQWNLRNSAASERHVTEHGYHDSTPRRVN